MIPSFHVLDPRSLISEASLKSRPALCTYDEAINPTKRRCFVWFSHNHTIAYICWLYFVFSLETHNTYDAVIIMLLRSISTFPLLRMMYNFLLYERAAANLWDQFWVDHDDDERGGCVRKRLLYRISALWSVDCHGRPTPNFWKMCSTSCVCEREAGKEEAVMLWEK